MSGVSEHPNIGFARRFIEVMQAFVDGAEIEELKSVGGRNMDAEWRWSRNPAWDWSRYTYRVKEIKNEDDERED